MQIVSRAGAGKTAMQFKADMHDCQERARGGALLNEPNTEYIQCMNDRGEQARFAHPVGNWQDKSDAMFYATVNETTGCMTQYSKELGKRACLTEAIRAMRRPAANAGTGTTASPNLGKQENCFKLISDQVGYADCLNRNFNNAALALLATPDLKGWQSQEISAAAHGDVEASARLCAVWHEGRIKQGDYDMEARLLQMAPPKADEACERMTKAAHAALDKRQQATADRHSLENELLGK